MRKTPITILSLAELCDQADRHDWRSLRQWGPWRLDTRTLELVFEEKPGCQGYFIDLETICCSAQMLDWIFQVEQKIWCTPEVMGHLIAAFQDIFTPQARLCSRGIGKRLNATAYLRGRYRGAAE